ncbi:MAG TPA: DNA methyltransferase [Polyangiaceae bacterium]|jgi:hypothetical protein|nr:DNA methyltransferase [Polyangiaceae bacterium]
MRRDIFRADALAWMAESPAPPRSSVITSIPDWSEVPGLDLEGWRAWSMATARTVVEWTGEDGVAIFFQSDIRVGGTWVDKGYLILRAIEDCRASLVWHKIVCRKNAGTATYGRSSYSHMICASRSPRPPPRVASPDVLPDAGFMPWSKAMGANACALACRYLKDETDTEIVVDPFCGNGTALAVANAMGLSAIGVDKSARRCRAAKQLCLERDGAGQWVAKT